MIPNDAPAQVREVAELAIASAVKAGLTARAVYVHKDTPSCPGYKPRPEWIITDNYEQGFGSWIFNTETQQWSWRDPYDGADKLLKGGFNEAKASAEIWFTG